MSEKNVSPISKILSTRSDQPSRLSSHMFVYQPYLSYYWPGYMFSFKIDEFIFVKNIETETKRISKQGCLTSPVDDRGRRQQHFPRRPRKPRFLK